MHCRRCGATNQPTARFCHSCGAQLSGATLPLGVAVQGRYTILGLLGQGGMGAVYQVADVRLGGKIMALKELSDAAITSPQAKTGAAAAFAREAQLLANLDHPNIPKVTDFFTETGKYYLVMEFVEGETLEARLTRQGAPVSEADARDWALQLCDVLTYLHGRNPSVIFRDLKPANIMLTPQGQIKLVDFGIARLFNPMKAGDTLVIGTPGYAPPEQYGKGQTDVRSDIYSLGVVLHTLLTGHDPAATPFALPRVRQLNPAISPQMEGVIQRATQLDPAQRYQTVAQMRAALMGHGTAPTAVMPLPAGRRRWAMPVGILLVVIVGVIAAAAAALSGGNRSAWTPAPVTEVARAVSSETRVIPAAAATADPAGRSLTTGALLTVPPVVTTRTSVPPTHAPPPPTATRLPPTKTPVPPTPTVIPPTLTPLPTNTPPPPTATRLPPTPACAQAVDGQFANVWDRGLLGCPAGATRVVWAAWQPFQGGYMLWRSDLNTVYVLFSDGSWIEIPDKWDGYSTAGRGEPPAGLRAPERGFGWVWGTRNDVFNRLGWALDQEKGFCTAVQPMERGFIFQSNRVQSCQDGLYNWATHPEFRPLLFRVMTNGTWRLF